MNLPQEKQLKDLMVKKSHDDIKSTLYRFLIEQQDAYLGKNDSQCNDYWETEKINKEKKRLDIISVPLKTIIEVKSKNDQLDLSNKRKVYEPQLKNYLQEASERDSNSTSTMIWIGILTDGKYWFKYDFDRSKNKLFPKERIEKEVTINKIEDFIQSEIFRQSENVTPLQIPNEDKIYQSTNPIRKECVALGRKIYHKKFFKTKLKLWRLVLSGSGILEHDDIGHPKTQDLFCNHSFMVVTSRLIIAYMDNPQINQNELIQYLGDGFHAWLVESDEGLKLMSQLLIVIKSYHWEKTTKDILKHLYQWFIESENRKEFGEFYTPDDLAKHVVKKVLDTDWLDYQIDRAHEIIHDKGESLDKSCLGVLDPSCGSGTFLFHCVKRIKERIRDEHDDKLRDASRIIAMLVHGVDIHPIAVEMSKATLRIALEDTIKPYEYKIALGDAMQSKDKPGSISIPIPTTDENDPIEIPAELYIDRDFRNIIEKINEHLLLKNQNQKTGKIIYDRLKILEELNTFIEQPNSKLSKINIKFFVDSLFEVIDKQGDHVWCWYLQNIITLINLNENKVSRLVGNPPWQVRNNAKESKRKDEIKKMSVTEGVFINTRGYLSNIDLAAVLTAKTTRLYLSEQSGQYGWVLPESPIKGQAWEKWRKGKWSNEIWVEHQEMWNLSDVELPIFTHSPNGCSVVLGKRIFPESIFDKPTIKVYSGDYFKEPTVERVEYKNIFPSPYIDRVERGVMYGPFCYYQVIIDEKEEKPFKKLCKIKPEKLGKGKNWDGCGYEGIIERSALLPLIDSKYLKRLNYNPELWLIVPLENNKLMPTFTTFNEMSAKNKRREKKYPYLHAYWEKCNEQYGKKKTKTSAEYLELNYGFKKDVEDELNKCRIYGQKKIKVVYNSSGNTLRAIRVPANIMTNSKVYYILCDTEKEAQYLVGVFNAPIMQSIWRKTKTSTLHYHKSPLKSIPVPIFNLENETHLGIANEIDRLENLPPPRKNEDVNFEGLNPWLEKLLPDYVHLKHVIFI